MIDVNHEQGTCTRSFYHIKKKFLPFTDGSGETGRAPPKEPEAHVETDGDTGHYTDGGEHQPRDVTAVLKEGLVPVSQTQYHFRKNTLFPNLILVVSS